MGEDGCCPEEGQWSLGQCLWGKSVKGIKGKLHVPYSVSVSASDHNPGPPTQKKACKKLIQDKKITELAGMDSTGGVQLNNMALHIEHEQ